MQKYTPKNKASKPSYQSFFHNYKLEPAEIQILLMFEQWTGIVPDYGDSVSVKSKEDFRRYLHENIEHFKSCAQEIVNAVEKKEYELLGSEYD